MGLTRSYLRVARKSGVRRPLPVVAFIVMAASIILTACGSDAGASSYPIVPTDELVGRGQPIYQENCALCHGDATTPPPLASAPPHTDAGHTAHHPDRLLVDWILDGVPGGDVMPTWREELSEEEVRAVVAYIKTFWPEDVRQTQIDESQQYEEQIQRYGG